MSEQKYFHTFMFSHLQKQILITGQISRAYVLLASSHYYSLTKYSSKNLNYLWVPLVTGVTHFHQKNDEHIMYL